MLKLRILFIAALCILVTGFFGKTSASIIKFELPGDETETEALFVGSLTLEQIELVLRDNNGSNFALDDEALFAPEKETTETVEPEGDKGDSSADTNTDETDTSESLENTLEEDGTTLLIQPSILPQTISGFALSSAPCILLNCSSTARPQLAFQFRAFPLENGPGLRQFSSSFTNHGSLNLFGRRFGISFSDPQGIQSLLASDTANILITDTQEGPSTPEPATWLLLILGLAVTTIMARKVISKQNTTPK